MARPAEAAGGSLADVVNIEYLVPATQDQEDRAAAVRRQFLQDGGYAPTQRGCLSLLQGIIERRGVPLAVYTDGHAVFQPRRSPSDLSPVY